MLNLDDYIKSGILEEYAMGLLPEDQAEEVFRMAQIHPRVKREIQRIEQTLKHLSFSYGVKPPVGLGPLIQAKVISGGARLSKKPSIPRPQLLAYASAAMMFLFLALVLSLYLNTRSDLNEIARGTNFELTQLRSQNEELARQLKQANNLAIQRTRLVTANDEQQYAWVYTGQNELLVCTSYLPSPPENQQYQLWSIVQGQTMNSGVIPLQSTGAMSSLTRYTGTGQYAITIEPIGGSRKPTLDKIIVSGGVIETKF
ncbi:MAG: anti-sigma factor [Cytophagales bacterium]|nr:anti-sigma factor [Cytophagales bacterium]